MQIRKNRMEGNIWNTPLQNPLASHLNNSLEKYHNIRRNLINLIAIVCEKEVEPKINRKL